MNVSVHLWIWNTGKCLSYSFTHFYSHTKILRYSFMTLNATCAAVDVATAKVIAAEVIICYLGMLWKCKTAVLAWFSAFQVQYEVSIDGYGGNKKNYLGVSGRFYQIFLVRIELTVVQMGLSIDIRSILATHLMTRMLNISINYLGFLWDGTQPGQVQEIASRNK